MKLLGSGENMDDLVQRAKKIMEENESKALVLRRDTPPAKPRGGSEDMQPWHVVRQAKAEWAGPANPPMLVGTEAVRLDLPRVCADTGELWCARYLREPGQMSWRYIRSVVANARMGEVLYTPDSWRLLPGHFQAGIEDCPHCGAYTLDGWLGAVYCNACQSWCCFGRTSRSGLFTCRCGRQSQLTVGNRTPMGSLG